jgi:hypothetical protein
MNEQEENGLRTVEGVHLFGIRHLSAAGAWHIRRFLDEKKPDIVLIESPSDTEPLIADLTRGRVKPPVALLCYTAEAPVQSLLYPLARYSPEYQALLWVKERKRTAWFMDLPSNVRTSFSRLEDKVKVEAAQKREEVAAADSAKIQPLSKQLQNRFAYYDYSRALFAKTAELSGEPDYDAYWERNFEHNLSSGSYVRAVAAESASMREMSEGWEKEADPLAASINALREAYMKRRIMEALAEGFAPDKIVAVMGAYHVSGVAKAAAMDDSEFAGLPQTETRMTLMPYTYYRLSSFSGYGAGNYAPYYFELMFDAMEAGSLDSLPARYIAELSRIYRGKQGYSSTASAIEAVRLAQSLQYLHGGLLPTLQDLHDAAIATLAGGSGAAITEAFAALDVGTRVGSLPEGVSRTPIQDDMARQLKKLKLDKYKSPVAQTLELDLRENRRVKSEEAAFIDLRRSVFLNRLSFLDIGFASRSDRQQDAANWAECWNLCWKEEVEIRLVESVLYGETVEAAASYIMKERFEKSEDLIEVAHLVHTICDCDLSNSILDALKKLQELASGTENYGSAAKAAQEMSHLVQYGTIRKFDTSAVTPLLRQLFLKAALLLYGSASCDDATAKDIAADMNTLHRISQQNADIVNDEIWLVQLSVLAKAGDRNPLLSGFACSILLERAAMTESELSTQVSRYLSAGNTPESGAAWFEGLSMRNRQLLLSRIELWRNLDSYLGGLDDGGFKRALVCLRRAFSNFSASEKAGICEVLASIWNVDSGNAAEALLDKLSEGEEAAVQEAASDLNDFDFGDL